MNWRVVWGKGAEADLAAIWLGSRFRNQISDAVRRIDDTLSRDPENAGESRIGEWRILFCEPLVCHFVVDSSLRLAVVVAIWKTYG